MSGTSKQVKEISQTSRVGADAARSLSSFEARAVDCPECDPIAVGTPTPIGPGGPAGRPPPWVLFARMLGRFFTWPVRKIVSALG